MSGGDVEAGMHGGVGGAVSGDDDVIGEPDGENGGDDEVGCVGQVICTYPYVNLNVAGGRGREADNNRRRKEAND